MSKPYKYIFLFLTFFLISYHTQAQSWIGDWAADKTWDRNAEKAYIQYVKDNFNENYFVDRSFWTDCADAGISLRNIFAYENGYPLAYRSRGHTGKLNILPRGTKRQVKRFLSNMRWMVSTHTIFNDTYPVRIHKDSLVPGSIFLYPAFHTLVVSKVEPRGTIHFLGSTVPPEIRTLSHEVFSESDIELYHPEYRYIKKKDGGFRYFKRPVREGGRWKYRYDLELQNDPNNPEEDQFTHGNEDMTTFVSRLIANSHGVSQLSDKEKMNNMLDGLHHKIADRIDVVCDGYQACHGQTSTTSGVCDRGLNGAHSTPGRDSKLYNLIDSINQLSRAYTHDQFSDLYADNLVSVVKSKPPIRGITCNGTGEISFLNAILTFYYKKASSDPVDNPSKRWGIPLVIDGWNVDADSADSYWSSMILDVDDGS